MLQPDQQPQQWSDHVAVYEAVFEPLTDKFASEALAALDLKDGDRLLDIAAGTGGAALMAGHRGCMVTAVDASENMVSRIQTRAAAQSLSGTVTAGCMDGHALTLEADQFDAAISIFGVVLFPDATQGLREAYRVLRPGGRIAVVTWTQPEKYELAARLIRAAAIVRGETPFPASLPAQLRFREEPVFRSLFESAGFRNASIATHTKSWSLPSTRWIAERIAFAPGMAAMLASYGPHREPIIEEFVAQLERDQGHGEISLSATAFVGLADKPRQ